MSHAHFYLLLDIFMEVEYYLNLVLWEILLISNVKDIIFAYWLLMHSFWNKSLWLIFLIECCLCWKFKILYHRWYQIHNFKTYYLIVAVFFLYQFSFMIQKLINLWYSFILVWSISFSIKIKNPIKKLKVFN